MAKNFKESKIDLLPTRDEIKFLTKGELARVIYWSEVNYDVTLPQDWVNAMMDDGFDPRGEVVWAYPLNYCMGLPAPLFQETCVELEKRGQQYFKLGEVR